MSQKSEIRNPKSERPALIALIPYVLGIFVGRYVSPPLFWVWAGGWGVVAGGWWLGRKSLFVSLHMALFACGILRLGIHLTSPIPADFYDKRVHFSGQMVYQPENGEQWEAGYAKGTLTRVGESQPAIRAKLLIRFREPVSLHYGDRIEISGELRQPEGRRNPGGFDYRFYLAQRGVFGVLVSDKGYQIVPTHQGGLPPLRWLESLRRRTEAAINRAYQRLPEHAQVLTAMFLGGRSALPQETIASFQAGGVAHVLAVSGLHVGLIAGVVWAFFSVLRLPYKAVCYLTIAAVLAYAGLVGFRPSVLRAALMAVLFLTAKIIDRDTDLANLLAFVALVLLLVNPAQVWDVGFQLSFAAVGTIVYLMPRWDKFALRFQRRPAAELDDGDAPNLFPSLRHWARKSFGLTFGITLAAQVGTALISAAHFHRAYPIGLVSNIFVLWLVSPIVSLALCSTLLALVWSPLAIPFVYMNHGLLAVFLAMVDFFAALPGADLKVPPPTLSFSALFIFTVLAVAHWRTVWKHKSKTFLVCLVVAAVWVWESAIRDTGALLDVTFLDVGQGDAAFVRFPDGRTMLLDGGMAFMEYDSGKRVIEPFLLHRGVRRLDLMMLSHPDNDHGGGLRHILETFRVSRVLGLPHQDLASSTHRALHALADERRIPHALGSAGELPLTPTARLELLHPFDEASVDLFDRDVNNDSLVLKITYKRVSVLFAGDIEKEVESALAARNSPLQATILKAPHHGSKTSSTAEFLNAVRPRYAILSLGERNRYGFPAKAVIERYQARNCRILRTDQHGAIRILTDGHRCWISTNESHEP